MAIQLPPAPERVREALRAPARAREALADGFDALLEAGGNPVRPADPSTARLWQRLGFPQEILDNSPECAEFLKQSRLVYAIKGYQNSWNNELPLEMQQGIRVDEHDGHPLIFFEGNWTRWDNIEPRLTYDADKQAIVSVNNREEVWEYYYPAGLSVLPSDRLVPIYKLTQEQLERLREISGAEPDQAMLQTFTGRYDMGIPDTPLLRNLKRQVPSHVAVRFIHPLGTVYSIGYGMDSSRVRAHSTVSGVLATSNTFLKSMDPAEFRPFSRREVTTIALTEERRQELWEKWNQQMVGPLRFNFAQQNCAVFGAEQLRIAGEEVDTQMTMSGLLYASLPNLSDIPFVGGLLDRIHKVVEAAFEYVPQPILWVFSFAYSILTYIPSKVATVAINTISMGFGSSYEMDVVEEAEAQSPEPRRSMRRLIDTWSDLFDDEIPRFAYSSPVTEWQERQGNRNVSFAYDGPKLYVVPDLRA